jgi:16S rRNA processing protein RimM
MTDSPEHLVVGQVVSAFGLRGEVKIKVHSDAPERYRDGAVVYLQEDDEMTPLTVASSRPHKQHLLVLFEGFGDRTEAESLHGRMLVIPIDQASPLEEDEYYPHEVTGARVTTEDGEELGEIVEVLFTGANDVFVVRGQDGEILIPVLKSVVLKIDQQNGVVLVDLPPGLL